MLPDCWEFIEEEAAPFASCALDTEEEDLDDDDDEDDGRDCCSSGGISLPWRRSSAAFSRMYSAFCAFVIGRSNSASRTGFRVGDLSSS